MLKSVCFKLLAAFQTLKLMLNCVIKYLSHIWVLNCFPLIYQLTSTCTVSWYCWKQNPGGWYYFDTTSQPSICRVDCNCRCWKIRKLLRVCGWIIYLHCFPFGSVSDIPVSTWAMSFLSLGKSDVRSEWAPWGLTYNGLWPTTFYKIFTLCSRKINFRMWPGKSGYPA